MLNYYKSKSNNDLIEFIVNGGLKGGVEEIIKNLLLSRGVDENKLKNELQKIKKKHERIELICLLEADALSMIMSKSNKKEVLSFLQSHGLTEQESLTIYKEQKSIKKKEFRKEGIKHFFIGIAAIVFGIVISLLAGDRLYYGIIVIGVLKILQSIFVVITG